MKQRIDSNLLAFEELSRDYSDEELKHRLNQTDMFSAVAASLLNFSLKAVIVLGLLFAFLHRSEMGLVIRDIVVSLLLLTVLLFMRKRMLTSGQQEFRESALRKVRLMTFAEKSKLHYKKSMKSPSLSGVPQKFSDRLWLHDAVIDNGEVPTVLIGNALLNFSDKSTVLYSGGVLGVRLDAAVSQLYLDSTKHDAWKLKAISEADYRQLKPLTLEGDFNEYFQLYCKPGEEQEALYIIAPELMQAMIDYSLYFEIEVIGSWLFMYREEQFTYSENEVRELIKIINKVGGEFVHNTRNL